MKRKLSTLFVLLVCALAAATSLTPIVAKALSAPQGNEQDCRDLLAGIVRQINLYRQEHNGDFPRSLREVGGPFYCPEHFTPITLTTGEILRPDDVTPEGLAAFQSLARSIDWTRVPIVTCTSHFDNQRVLNVMWIDRSERNLSPRPMPVPRENMRNAFLGATLNGSVDYHELNEDVVESVSTLFRTGLPLRERTAEQ
jgi:hypothetical protein